MAAFAYLLLPVTGIAAYMRGSTPRVRFHGLQALALGVLWPVLMFVAAEVSAYATLVVASAGALVWLVLLIGTLAGRDPRIPWLGSRLRSAAADPPWEVVEGR